MAGKKQAADAQPGLGRVLVFGDVINDIIVRPLHPVTIDSDTESEIAYRPGGSAANQACWLGHLGIDTSFVGRTGGGDTTLHKEMFSAYGVHHHLVSDPQDTTGTIVILVDGQGHRTMYVDRGASLRMQSDDVPDELLAGVDLLHFTAYSLFGGDLETQTMDILARAAARWVPVSVDPSSVAFLRDYGPARFLERTHGARFCFPNYDEGALLAGLSEPDRIALALTEHYETVVLSLDSRGVVVCDRGEEPVFVPVTPAEAVDPTGAGDSLCAGFLRGWFEGRGSASAAAEATRVAAQAVSQLGARPPIT